MTQDDWKKNGAGVLVPPDDKKKPVIERATFVVKVQGFAPPAENPSETIR